VHCLAHGFKPTPDRLHAESTVREKILLSASRVAETDYNAGPRTECNQRRNK